MFAQTALGILFGKASRRTFRRFGMINPCWIGNSLKVKSSNTNPFLIKSPSEALEESISMAVFLQQVRLFEWPSLIPVLSSFYIKYPICSPKIQRSPYRLLNRLVIKLEVNVTPILHQFSCSKVSPVGSFFLRFFRGPKCHTFLISGSLRYHLWGKYSYLSWSPWQSQA